MTTRTTENETPAETPKPRRRAPRARGADTRPAIEVGPDPADVLAAADPRRLIDPANRTDVVGVMPVLMDQLGDLLVTVTRERDQTADALGEALDHQADRLGGGVVDASLLADAQREVEQLREQLASTTTCERTAPVGYVPGCADCATSNQAPGTEDRTGHHCTECREGSGEWTPVPHGFEVCPTHVRQLVEVVDRLEAAAAPAPALLDDPDLADPNGEAGELSAQQIEELADKLVELLGTSGGWVGVTRRWADVELGAVFLGRKGDLWLVSKAGGAPGEFDKGKVTVEVYGITPSGNPGAFARSFDADELATILVPAAERDAIGVLRAQFDTVKQLGPVERNGAGA